MNNNTSVNKKLSWKICVPVLLSPLDDNPIADDCVGNYVTSFFSCIENKGACTGQGDLGKRSLLGLPDIVWLPVKKISIHWRGHKTIPLPQ
jgi:hypothetical protein